MAFIRSAAFAVYRSTHLQALPSAKGIAADFIIKRLPHDTWTAELVEFNGRNRQAYKFADKALDDYLLARLGIQHFLTSAFEMSTQAVEKLLKSYLLFKDPSLGGSAQKLRKAIKNRSKARFKLFGRKEEDGHDVEAALDLAARLGLSCSTDLRTRLARINDYYARRYPDCGGPTTLCGAELEDVDEAVFEIWDSFQAIHPDYYYVCGISKHVYALHVNDGDLFNWFRIMSAGNLSYARRKQSIEAGIKERLAADDEAVGPWHPGNQ